MGLGQMSKIPYNVMRHKDWDAAPRSPQAVGALILGSAVASTVVVGTGAAALTLGAVVGYAAITAVTYVANKLLAPKMPSYSAADYEDIEESATTENKGTLINSKNSVANQEYIYGKVRKGGTITFMDSSGEDNKYLHIVIALAGHEVYSIDDIYINDQIVSINGSGYVTNNGWDSKIRIRKHKGNQTTGDSALVSETSMKGSGVGKGIAYIYARLEWDQDVFAGGIPTFTAIIRGKKVYDPRNGSTGYSNNAALCVRDYITSSYGLSDSQVDDTYFASAANDCDENVPKAGGGTQDRYEMDGVVNSKSSIGKTLEEMMQSCNGELYFSGGEWKLRVGVYESPTKIFTLDDLRSSISLQTRFSRREIFNRVTGKIMRAEDDWIESDYPAIQSSAFLSEDNGIENTLDVPFSFITDHRRAQRVAKQMLYRMREQMTFDAEFGLNAVDVEIGDTVQLTIDKYGWNQKDFIVASWRLLINDNGGIRIGMSLRETSSTAFDWNAEEQEIISNNTNLPDFRDVPDVGLSVTGELRLVNQEVVGTILIDVSSDSTLISHYEVQYRKTGDASWTSLGISSTNRFEVVGVQDGFFDFRARGVNILGIRGDWAYISNRYITLFTEIPQNVTNFGANTVGHTLHLSWTPVPDLDLSHYEIRYSPVTIGAEWSSSVVLIPKVARPATTASSPARTGTYLIKAVDKLGFKSADATQNVIINDLNDILGLNVIQNFVQNPDFDGVKDDVALVVDGSDSYLVLSTSDLFDEVAGDFDDATGLFDGGSGSVASSGFYYFDNEMDLGAKYTSYIRSSISFNQIAYIDRFDSAGGDFDQKAGLFDGDTSNYDSATAKVQYAYSDDSPAVATASGTWSGWIDLVAADISARSIKFRAHLETVDGTLSPRITALSAIVDMPDAVQSENDIAVTGSKSITYPAPFYTTSSPSIGISATGLSSGDYYVIGSKTNAGFTASFYDASDNLLTQPVELDYISRGFGKETA